MKRKNKKEKAFLLVIALLLVSFKGVYALGITPGRATFVFEPGLERIVNFSVVNTEHKVMEVSIRVEGEWSQYVTLNKNRVEFNSSEEIKTIRYRVKFPLRVDNPGIKAKIIATEVSNISTQRTSVSVKITVEHQLYVLTNITNITKPTKPEEKEINVTRVFVESYYRAKPAKVEIEITNPSTSVMKNVYATMLVFDKYGTLRSQFNSSSTDIEPNTTKIISAYWNTVGFEEGSYGANLIVYYDNKTDKQSLIIYLGADRIEIDFGKFEFEEKLPMPIPEFEKIKPEIIILIAAIVLFIIMDVIVYLKHFKKHSNSVLRQKKTGSVKPTGD